MFKIITRLLPRKLVEHLEKLFWYSRIKANKENFIGFLFIISLITAIVFSFSAKIIFGKSLIITFFLSFFILLIGFYFIFF